MRKRVCQSFPHQGDEPSRLPVPNFLSIIAPPPLTLPKPLYDFPFCAIVVNRRRYACSKMPAKKPIPGEYVCSPLKKASLRCVWVPPKEGQLLSWRGCRVPPVVFGKGERDASVFLSQIFLILAFEASAFSLCVRQCCSGLVDAEWQANPAVSKTTAKRLLIGCCSPFKGVVLVRRKSSTFCKICSFARLWGLNEKT